MELDLSKSVYELVTAYPQLKDMMFDIGFKEIAKPGMLQTAGRYMTIPKGAKMKKIPLEEVIVLFEANGFEVKGV
ncbi:DUF1858 domain-containing protein [Enterococcus saccharolyticus]|uniref:DUF1858 domain-containing protein n=1 Tax=Enterococcus saccharolyticus TaxID=41997 RepID=UPI0039E07FB0